MKPWVGFKDISLDISDRQTHVYTRAAVAKNRYSSISAFATRPGLHLIGWVDRF